MSSAINELWQRLIANRLIPTSWLNAASELVKATNDPSMAVQKLTEMGVLTPYQSVQILRGRESELLIGGKYLVRELLGKGGMGAVYLCEHISLQTLVAVKVTPVTQDEPPDVRERFYREARAFATLRHPNLVRGFDVDCDGDRDFIVMEYVEGIDLQALMSKASPLTVPRAVNYVRQAAAGLAHAHEKGWVHRDIKPGNLAVDRNGLVRVLDMGLARQLLEVSGSISENFDDGLVRGTADYLAPEQAEGKVVDGRADVYSLGLTLFFLLVGRPVFGGQNTAQKLVSHLTQTLPDLASLRPDVPNGLKAVFMRMTARDRTIRHPSAAEVVDALGEWDIGGPFPPTEADIPIRTTAPAPTTPRRPGVRTPETSATLVRSLSSEDATVSLLPPARVPPKKLRGLRYWARAVLFSLAMFGTAVALTLLFLDDGGSFDNRGKNFEISRPASSPFVGEYVTVTRVHGPGQTPFGADFSYLSRPIFSSVAEAVAFFAKSPRPGGRILLLDEYHQEPDALILLPSDLEIESVREGKPTEWVPSAGGNESQLVRLSGGQRVILRNLHINGLERKDVGLEWNQPGQGCGVESVQISKFNRCGVILRSASGEAAAPIKLTRLTVAPGTQRPVESCAQLVGSLTNPTVQVQMHDCLFASGGVVVFGSVQQLLFEGCRWYGLVNGIRFADEGALTTEIRSSTFAKVGTGVNVSPSRKGGMNQLKLTANLFFDTGLPMRAEALSEVKSLVIQAADNWSSVADSPAPQGSGVLPRAENLILGLNPAAERDFLRYSSKSPLATAARGAAVGAAPVADR